MVNGGLVVPRKQISLGQPFVVSCLIGERPLA